MATQLQIYTCYLLPFIFIWLALFFDWLPFVHENRFQILIGGPFLAVVLLGVYAVGTVLYGVATFNDCTEAREELVREIAEAKDDLRRRKVID